MPEIPLTAPSHPSSARRTDLPLADYVSDNPLNSLDYVLCLKKRAYQPPIAETRAV
ncbi:hypothetical protein ACH4OY_05175 [Micromonospora rubida]|uniref:Uncharacterized protein n=1 Tax=Micromonospora rubida TaxID=2697657 RepID=A0ABW7SJE8_9ACTN